MQNSFYPILILQIMSVNYKYYLLEQGYDPVGI